MTTQTYRDLYASALATKGTTTLERLAAAQGKIELIRFAKRAGRLNWDLDGTLDLRVLQLRGLVELARMAGKDPITVAMGDVVNLVVIDDLVQDMEEAIDEAERT